MSISFTDEFMVDTHQSGSLVSTFGDSNPRDQVTGAAALEEEAGLHPAACSAMRSENRMITDALGDMLCPHLPFFVTATLCSEFGDITYGILPSLSTAHGRLELLRESAMQS